MRVRHRLNDPAGLFLEGPKYVHLIFEERAQWHRILRTLLAARDAEPAIGKCRQPVTWITDPDESPSRSGDRTACRALTDRDLASRDE
jgi:hypothetical protein